MGRLDEIVAARDRIKGVAYRTPLVESPALSKRFGKGIYLKLECFQPIRVFKIRGAYNKISQVKSDKVVAASSGNHGIAVAYSSKILGKDCKVVVRETAVQEKLDAMAELGAEVIKWGRNSLQTGTRAREIANETGAVLVHAFDDPAVVAGQGTCGLEIAEQLKEFDSVIVPVGGGGLISGIATAVKSVAPSAHVLGVEPSGAVKLGASLKAGKRVVVESPNSIADGLLPSSVGDLAFKTCSRLVDGTLDVSDDEIISGMSLLAKEGHIFAEPSGATPVAALLAGRNLDLVGDRVVLVISGGNVSLSLLRRALDLRNFE